MNFQQFLFTVVNSIQAELEAGRTLTVQTIVKNHTEKIKTVSIYRGNKRETPLIYMMPFYRMYQQGYAVSVILKEVRNVLRMTENQENLREDLFLNYAAVCPRLSVRMISYERNRSLLELVPHRRFLDLAVIYQLTFEKTADSIGAAIVFEEHRKLWGITEDILFQTAIAAIMRKLPSSLMPLSMMVPGLPESMEAQQEMYVLTNTKTFFGAAVLLYPGVLREAYRRLQQGFYILPSSVHEVILLPYEPEYDPRQLQEMVREINQTELLPQEVLSDHVYRYEPDQDHVEIVL